ncbi:MAG: GNAT family N-acetyltransferase [Deferribacterales bacterium]
MNITKATLEDIPQLCDLLKILFSQEAEFSPDREKQSRGLEMIISNPDSGFIIKAEQDGRIVGMTNILFMVSTFLGERVCVLEDMVVHPDMRGQDIGTLIIKKAQQAAREAGCRRITLLTDNDNYRAQSFYENNGFSMSPMVTFRKMI